MALSTLSLSSENKAKQAFQLRGSMQTILCLRLLDLDAPDLQEKLLDKVAHAPDFFLHAPVVLDVAACADNDPGKLPALLDRLRDMRLVPVGIQNGNEGWREQASSLGLAIFTAGAEQKPAASPPKAEQAPAKPEKAPAPPPPAKSVHVKLPVRGGQQIVSKADMVVTASVSPGAEIAAVGNIHVYAPLRGRAFAGIEGDENTMIFCDSLDAELVSVAGIHKVNEEIDPSCIGQRCRIYLHDQELRIERLG